MVRKIPIDWLQIESHPRPSIHRGHPDSVMAELRASISTLLPGTEQSFVLENPHFTRHIYLAAKQIGAKIQVQKVDRAGWRVWRVS